MKYNIEMTSQLDIKRIINIKNIYLYITIYDDNGYTEISINKNRKINIIGRATICL